MTNDVNFDVSARKTIEPGSAVEDLNELYNRVFALPEGYFPARGELPDVAPHIAASAHQADGKSMIRAFTEKDRLRRFARENDPADADGSVSTLDVPTIAVVDYLEQFIRYDVCGIRFNSDSASDGFFAPLQQLRPVKEHLERINPKNSD